MTQEKIDKYFETEIGQQVEEFFVTSDDRVFLRWSEADLHRKGQLDPDTKPLEDDSITTWYRSDEIELDLDCEFITHNFDEVLNVFLSDNNSYPPFRFTSTKEIKNGYYRFIIDGYKFSNCYITTVGWSDNFTYQGIEYKFEKV